MKESIIIALLQNTAILLAFAMLYENFWIKNERSNSLLRKITVGVILSGIGIVLMYTPWTWVPGIVFDTRSVMISIAGLFFGPIPTLVTMVITSLVRLIMGGDGQWMGIAVIITSGTIGLLWRKYRPAWKSKRYYLELLAMGITVHITMSLCTFLLPPESILPTLKTIALPLILIYSPATVLLGTIMIKQYKNRENKNAQIKLVESERRLTQILESGNIVSLLLNKDGSIKYCNNYLLQITGYSLDELVGKNWFNIFFPSDSKDELYRLFQNDISSKNLFNHFENKILSKNREQIYISWYNTTFQSDSNEVIGMASIGVDITISKNYEIELKNKNIEYKEINRKLKVAKEKAEESERLKSVFLANMSHEIRTPMNGILGFADLMKEPNLSGEKQQEYIEIIEKGGARLLNIINNIIDVSKIEAGLMSANVEVSDINDQIDYVCTFFKPDLEAKGIQFFCKVPSPKAEFLINTDREKLFAILTNLVKNAIKFTLNGYIEFGYTIQPGKYLEFFVKDTGIGIPKNKQEFIFERFIQSDIEDKMARQGAGLGLAISKAYVELLGGKIWVESEEDKGSVFRFTIPYKPITVQIKKHLPSIDSERKKAPHAKELKILIAEDDETTEMLISIQIRKLSKEILRARNGKEAIEICKNNPDIDLILMDIQMPVLNGYHASQEIRQFNTDVIIIAQTAFGLSGDREKAIKAGCNDHISKPVSTANLHAIIDKYFS